MRVVVKLRSQDQRAKCSRVERAVGKLDDELTESFLVRAPWAIVVLHHHHHHHRHRDLPAAMPRLPPPAMAVVDEQVARVTAMCPSVLA